MPLPREGSVSVAGGSSDPKPAFLVKIPEHLWQQLSDAALAGERVKVSLDGEPSLILPHGETIPLQAHTTGNPTEIHTLDESGRSLTHVAQANARLSVPISASTSAKAAERVRAATEAHDKVKKANADRINGVAPPRPVAAVAASAATSMGRTQSSPSGISGAKSTPNSMPTTPVVPLKTRVVQLLALGPCPQQDMLRRLGGVEGDIMRVVNVVGRRVPGSVPAFELQPNQYSKIKIGEWPYSSSERKNVIARARKAFDELKLPFDADERIELTRKESSALRSNSNTSSEGSSGSGSMRHGLPLKPPASIAPPVKHAPTTTQATPMTHPLPARPATFFSTTSNPNIKPSVNVNAPIVKHDPVSNGNGIAVRDLPKIPKKEKPPTDARSAPIPKKDQGGQKTVFSRQLDKFRAEKRAASVPSARGERETASPRPSAAAAAAPVASGSKYVSKKAAAAEAREGSTSSSSERKRKPSGNRRNSRQYTSSASPSDKSGRKRASPDDEESSSSSSSDSDDDHRRGRGAHRGTPPKKKHATAQVNGHGPHHGRRPRSPDSMRERYEELYPAYELLTKKLTTIYQDCEDVELEGHLNTTTEEVAKLAARFQKWHNELQDIRQWFADDD